MNAPLSRRPSRRVLLVAGVLLAAVVLTGVVVLSRAGGGSTAQAAPAATTTTAGAPTSVALAPAPATPEPSGPTSDAQALPTSIAPVALDGTAAVGNGITADVLRLEAVRGTAVGPGNVSGPALRATVRISNGTAAPVSLDAVVVDLTYGRGGTPASPLDDPSTAPFRGTVEPGGSAQGVYVFTVPSDERDVVTVTVGYQAGAPFLVFTGAAR